MSQAANEFDNKPHTYGWEQRHHLTAGNHSGEFLVPNIAQRRSGNAIVYLLFFGVVLFVAWASWFEIDQAVRAQGNVIASARTQVVQVADGGVLESLLVKEGDKVKFGQRLAVLEKQRANASFEESKATLAGLRAGFIRAQAEAMLTKPDFSSLAAGYGELVVVQQRLYDQRQTTLQGELQTLHQALALADEELNMNTALFETGDISRLDVMRSQREVHDLQGQISQVTNNFLQQASQEASDLETQIAAARFKLEEKQNLLDHTVITAPVDGVVKYLSVNTLGGVLRPGDELMQLSPTQSDIVIEIKIRPMDVGQLELDLPVTVKLDAFDYAIYGALNGTLSYISSDTLTEQVGGQSHTYYRAQVYLDESSLQANDKLDIEDLKQGMTASADIKTGNRTVMQFIAKPILRAFAGALVEK